MEKKKITNNNQTYANMNQKTNSNLCMNLKSDAKVRGFVSNLRQTATIPHLPVANGEFQKEKKEISQKTWRTKDNCLSL